MISVLPFTNHFMARQLLPDTRYPDGNRHRETNAPPPPKKYEIHPTENSSRKQQ